MNRVKKYFPEAYKQLKAARSLEDIEKIIGMKIVISDNVYTTRIVDGWE